ncbi:MAG: hypothetical protein ACXACK_01055 [Candidatus Hodarchaeales archaeon]|jgi:hypothetical protein
MIFEDLLVLFVATPISFLILKKYKQDKIAFAWIVPWTLLLFIDRTGLELYFSLLLFSMGLVLGIITDIVGVYAHKWWYPHYNDRMYSLSTFWGWGIITLLIFRFYEFIMTNFEIFGWFFIILFFILWVGVDVTRGKTSLRNYWTLVRAGVSILFLALSNDILFLLVAAAGAVFIEVLGTELKIWIYYDFTPSYIYLGTGYAQLSYICLMIAKFIVYGIVPMFIQLILIGLVIILYFTEYYIDTRDYIRNEKNAQTNEAL